MYIGYPGFKKTNSMDTTACCRGKYRENMHWIYDPFYCRQHVRSRKLKKTFSPPCQIMRCIRSDITISPLGYNIVSKLSERLIKRYATVMSANLIWKMLISLVNHTHTH